jgi:hypothetical protein
MARFRNEQRRLTDGRSPAGLLNDEDGDVDLGLLERKLAERVRQARQPSQATSSSIPPSPGHAVSWRIEDSHPETPHSSSLSPGPGRDERRHSQSLSAEPGEVETLSEMMCSLVTSTTGDTNYTGGFWRVGGMCVAGC